ncbi:hypothetical protein BDM02DRAFT_3107827 [Thelephora ganbajun]|uniref:Uncharacterized protein n=1 Tax=Thelephora ganbajun TaxID=370292 RepID=A0ACB6ZTY7_THEGA|nr:hypothetical protein BDM02DRAFT_3107827 [Thelephora ganbajun]
MAMRLAFTKNSPLNTTLVDETSGVVMYEIETEKSFMSKTTIIRKPFTNRRGQLVPQTSTEVARILWKTWSSDRIVYYGCDMKRGDFMPKAGMFSNGFVITVNGTKYRWSTGFSGQGLPKLVTNNRKKKLIAELHKAHRLFRRSKAYLEIAPAGLTMLDQIVVSFVYVESKRRERKQDSGDGGDDGDGDDGGGGDGGGGA